MRIDGVPTTARGSLLDSCRDAGIALPAFCHDERLGGGGHCRACLVEVDGQHRCACSTAAAEGMEVRTDSPELLAYRRDLGELMLAEGHAGSLAATLQEWGCDGERYRNQPDPRPADHSHPYLRLDPQACIRCRLCERACAQVQGQFVYAFVGRGSQTRLDWGGGDFVDSPCVACGACVEACPSGAISDRDRLSAGSGTSIGVTTTCGYCGVGCGLEVRVSGQRIEAIDGQRGHPVNDGHLCLKGRYAHRFVDHPERLRTPLIRIDGELRPASWEEAFDLIARRLAPLRGEQVGALSSSRCTNEENYLVQKWLRAGLHSHNVDCCARVCHAPTATGMRRVLGTGAATNSLADLEAADLILVAGSNATEAHPVVGARIRQAVLRGARLIVIDPRRTELADLADVHLALRAGSNVPLLNAFAQVLIAEDLIDQAFLEQRTEGYQQLCRHLADCTPERSEAHTGVPAAQLRAAARLYGRARRPLQVHGLGMTEHYQGSESVMLLCNLALLVGAIGRPGVGVNPLRGQNNVQGAADMGCQPNLMTGYADPADPAVRERFEAAWERPLPVLPGLTIPRMYDAAIAGQLKALYILGEDVLQTDPSQHAERALRALDFLIVQELFLSPTAALADVVLPGASFLEKDGSFTNGERRVQRVRQCLPPPGQAQPDWRILVELMTVTGLPQRYSHPDEILAEVASLVPTFAGLTLQRLGTHGLQWPVPQPSHQGTPILHGEGFPQGRAQLACIDYLPSPNQARAGDYPLRLTTGRVLDHYNSGSMTRRTANRQLQDADELELHPADAAERGIADGDAVQIRSADGQARARARLSARVARGSAFLSFHFPETGTNQLTSAVLDRLADCPEYKLVQIEVAPAASA